MEGLTQARPLTPDRLDRPFTDPVVTKLFPPLATGVHWELERVERALEALGDPHRSYRSVHIGGTNGKGSVASTVASVLDAAGHRTGCYLSPHLCSFRERMLVGGHAMSEERVLAYADEVRDAVARFGLTFFEAITVLCLYSFAREDVEVAVVEVGLGGRLDATNVLRPEVTAVTNVAMDHAEYLGDTLALIAREKAGIMKPGVPFVTAERDPELRALFTELARTVGAPLTVVGEEQISDISVSTEGTELLFTTPLGAELRLRTPLIGWHQAFNAALAAEILSQLPDDLRPAPAEIRRGIESVDYRGRDELAVVGGQTWLLDVAHNTAGIMSLVDTIDRLELPRPLVALVGVLGDKDWRSMLPALFSRADAAVLTQPPSAPEERRWDPRAAADAVEGLTHVRVVEDFEEALKRARERAGRGTVVVTGSVHTVGSALLLLGRAPLASPRPGA